MRASHIWKRATAGDGLADFGLRTSDLHSPRNGLLLATQLEEAFDSKRLAFRYNVLHDTFTARVLDPSLLGARDAAPSFVLSAAELDTLDAETRAAVPTVAEMQGRSLTCPPGQLPFRRLLAWHYALSVKHAVACEWLPAEEEEAAEAEARGWATGSPGAVWPRQMDEYDAAVARSARGEDSDAEFDGE